MFGGGAVAGAPWNAIDALGSPVGLLLLIGGTVCWSIFNLQDGVLAGLRRTGWVPIENGIYAVVKILVLLVGVLILPSMGIVVSWIVPSILPRRRGQRRAPDALGAGLHGSARRSPAGARPARR